MNSKPSLNNGPLALSFQRELINPLSDTYPDTLRTDTWCLAGPLYIYMHLYASMTYLNTHFCQKQVNIFHLLPFSVVLAYYVLIRINVKKFLKRFGL